MTTLPEGDGAEDGDGYGSGGDGSGIGSIGNGDGDGSDACSEQANRSNAWRAGLQCNRP